MIVSTGSQGEPLSALRRMAHRDHPQVELHAGDTVVFSATPIPGNERAVNETIDRLYHIGCERHHDPRRADPRLGPRLRRGAQAHAQPRRARATSCRSTATTSASTCTAQLAEAVGDRRATRIFKGENGLPLELDARRRALRGARSARG